MGEKIAHELLKYHPYRLRKRAANLLKRTIKEMDAQSKGETKGIAAMILMLQDLISRDERPYHGDYWSQNQTFLIMEALSWFADGEQMYSISQAHARKHLATDVANIRPSDIKLDGQDTIYVHWGQLDGLSYDAKHVDGSYISQGDDVISFHITTHDAAMPAGRLRAVEYLHNEPHCHLLLFKEENHTLTRTFKEYKRGNIIDDETIPDFMSWEETLGKACRLAINAILQPATMTRQDQPASRH